MNDDGSVRSPVYCINCGAQAKGVANYCHDCGSPIYRGAKAEGEEALSDDALGYQDSDDRENADGLSGSQTEFQPTDIAADSGVWANRSSASKTLPSRNQIKPLEYYLMAWKRYAVFQGRSRRREFWYFTLFNFLALVATANIEVMVGLSESYAESVLADLYGYAAFIPSIAVGVRRLHDTNHSGWWYLLPVVNIVFMCRNGQSESNRYGNDPKGPTGASASLENGSAEYTV